MTFLWNAVSAGAVILSALNVTPQLVKSWRTKRTRDLSFGMLGIVITGNTLWILHGLHRADLAILVANVVLLLNAVTLTLLKLKYDAAPPPASPARP